MKAFPINALTERDFDGIVEAPGGKRAHPDADRRLDKGADYLVGSTIIELKFLDEEGFDKPERQAKLARLFSKNQPYRPVVILDPSLLSESEQREYRSIIEQPVKGAIAKAKRQLAQSRCELPFATGSVLWIFNNNYTALDHDMLESLAANRVRQDTSKIDGVIVSGCYYHSDGFSSMFLWPCEYLPIRVGSRFAEFEKILAAFQDFLSSYMTQYVRQSEPKGNKFEVRDLVFDLDGIRYVRPAPIMGEPSDFYINGRPRTNSSGLEIYPPVAWVVPELRRGDHERIAHAQGQSETVFVSWASWQRHISEARQASTPTKRLVQTAIDADNFLLWCKNEGKAPSLKHLNKFAFDVFDKQIEDIINHACDLDETGILPSAYILVVTQEIGQDRANDVSDIALVRERGAGEPIIRALAENLRIFHEQAVALAAAYALEQNVESVRWLKNQRHGWI
jgi:hypothetical protein